MSKLAEIKAIFAEASKLVGAEREAYLSNACQSNTALRMEVERLLASHDGSGPQIVTSEAQTRAAGMSRALEGPGHMIGRYKLLQEIGQGGFGVVFMAEQQEPVRRRVALKIVKLGMDTKQVLARFEAERQALAMMEHPNIARVLDAGATETGRPYFVMELVKGIRITDYCDSSKVPIPGRLELFRHVCSAVQHAHQKGIIHRDIKPSNILVTMHDGEPVPKVIDFGIAKATHHRLSERTYFTEFGQFIGTPQYMSPEQAEMSALDVDTRSDIYSLGVLLYELLTGTTPLDPVELRSIGFGEIQRLIRETEAPAPSTRISSLITLDTVAQYRQTEPRRLGLLLRGDLDWIVLRALEKDRSRRYETAASLAEDVRRYLNDEPVTATPRRAGYAVRKFIRRHRAAVFSAVALTITLLLGMVGTSTGLWWALQEQGKAEDAADKAHAALRQAEASRIQAERDRNLAEQKTRVAARLYYGYLLTTAQDAIANGDYEQSASLLAQCAEEQRGWAWHWLSNAASRVSRVLRDPEDMDINDVAFTTDGTRLISASVSGLANVWDLATGQIVATYKGHEPDAFLLDVEASPDGKTAASVGTDRRVHLWEIDTGKPLHTFPGSGDPLRVANWLNGWTWKVSFSPDGNELVCGGDDGAARVYDLNTGKERLVLDGHPHRVWSAIYNPAGDTIVTSCFDGKVRFWDARTGKKRCEYQLSKDGGMWPWALAYTPDGRRLAISTNMGIVLLIDIVPAMTRGIGLDLTPPDNVTFTRNEIREQVFYGHVGEVFSVAISSDGVYLASSGEDGNVRIYEIETGAKVADLSYHREKARGVVFSPQGDLIASCSEDNTIVTWRDPRDQPALILDNHAPQVVPTMAFNPAGDRLFVIAQNVVVRGYDLLAGYPAYELRLPAWGTALDVSPDGKWLLHAANEQLTLVDVPARRIDKTLARETSYDQCLAIAPDNETAVVFARYETTDQLLSDRLETTAELRRYNLLSGAVEQRVNLDRRITALEYSPDGAYIATVSEDGTVSVVDAKSLAPRWEILERPRGYDVAISPDGQRIYTAHADGAVAVWDAETGTLGSDFQAHRSHVYSIDTSPDGQRLVTCDDRQVCVWDAGTHTRLIAMPSPFAHPRQVRFTPDGASIAHSGIAEQNGNGGVCLYETDSPLDRRKRALPYEMVNRLRKDAPLIDLPELIRSEQTAPDEVREQAIQISTMLTDDPVALNVAAWQLVKKPGAEPQTYERGRRLADEAYRLLPADRAIRNTFAMALFRCDEPNAALELLRTQPKELGDLPPWLQLFDDLLFALCHARNEELEPAWQYLDRATKVFAITQEMLDEGDRDEASRLFIEARVMLRQLSDKLETSQTY